MESELLGKVNKLGKLIKDNGDFNKVMTSCDVKEGAPSGNQKTWVLAMVLPTAMLDGKSLYLGGGMCGGGRKGRQDRLSSLKAYSMEHYSWIEHLQRMVPWITQQATFLS